MVIVIEEFEVEFDCFVVIEDGMNIFVNFGCFFGELFFF